MRCRLSRDRWQFQGLGSAPCWVSGCFRKVVNTPLPHSNRSPSHRSLPSEHCTFSFSNQRKPNWIFRSRERFPSETALVRPTIPIVDTVRAYSTLRACAAVALLHRTLLSKHGFPYRYHERHAHSRPGAVTTARLQQQSGFEHPSPCIRNS
jgi:hypothetical protein